MFFSLVFLHHHLHPFLLLRRSAELTETRCFSSAVAIAAGDVGCALPPRVCKHAPAPNFHGKFSGIFIAFYDLSMLSKFIRISFIAHEVAWNNGGFLVFLHEIVWDSCEMSAVGSEKNGWQKASLFVPALGLLHGKDELLQRTRVAGSLLSQDLCQPNQVWANCWFTPHTITSRNCLGEFESFHRNCALVFGKIHATMYYRTFEIFTKFVWNIHQICTGKILRPCFNHSWLALW